MKHAAPLTPFQEKLYDIVQQAYKEEIIIKEIPPIKFDSVEEVPSEVLPEIQKLRPVYDTMEPKWKEKGEYVFECLIGIIEDHITGLFLSIMTANVLWLQLLSTWIIPARNERMQSVVSLLKYFFLVAIVIYVIKRSLIRGKESSKKLKVWADTPIEKEKHVRQ